MWIYYAAIGLTIFSNVLYHIFQKATPGNVNPLISLFFTYLTAAAVCLVLFPFYPGREGILLSIKKVNWTSIALGIAIVGLEMGFLLAYRAGWNISLAGIFSNGTVALLLIPVGILLFREKLTPVNLAGIILCFGGLLLINKK
jgi:drug/metabolite transporter (DMT)-like permease